MTLISEAGGKDLVANLNPNSLKVLQAVVEPSLAAAKADDKFSLSGMATLQRIGWIMQRGRPVFNLAVGLKDKWKN